MRTLSERIKAFNAGRLAEMVQLKYEAMTENVFRFFRGTCHLFYEDIHRLKNLPPSPPTWVCGDLHLENFGSFKGDNKLVYFDLNDFDEAIRAPALWEVVRLLTSIFLAFYTLEIDLLQAENIASLFVRAYALTLSKGKAVSIEPRTARGIVCKFLKSAARSGYPHLMEKRTTKKNKKTVLSLQDERHFKIEKQLKKRLCDHITEWIKTSNDGPYNYVVKDAVFRLAGTGSIGAKRYLFLLQSTRVKHKYLLLDMKQSFPSSLEPFLRLKQPNWRTEAERIITIQQRMQHMSASLLGSTVFENESYVLQELQPVKDTIKFRLIKDSYRNLCQVIDDMAVLTASAQLRSGGMDGSAIIDELKAFGNDKEWQQQVVDFSMNYSNTVRKYYREYIKDFKRGIFKDAS